MPDSLEHVAPGQPFELAAATWNLVLDSTRRDQQRRLPGPNPGVPAGAEVSPWNVILIRNDTGSNLPPFYVVKLATVLGDPVNNPFPFRDRPLFSGVKPSTACDQIAVLYESIPTGQIGRGILLGLAEVDVYINAAGDNYAAPIANDSSKLTSGVAGPARIIWKAGNAGLQRCVVSLHDDGSAGKCSSSSSSSGGSGSSTSSAGACLQTLAGPIASIAGYNAAKVQMLGHDAGGCLRWYDTAQC